MRSTESSPRSQRKRGRAVRPTESVVGGDRCKRSRIGGQRWRSLDSSGSSGNSAPAISSNSRVSSRWSSSSASASSGLSLSGLVSSSASRVSSPRRWLLHRHPDSAIFLSGSESPASSVNSSESQSSLAADNTSASSVGSASTSASSLARRAHQLLRHHLRMERER